MSVDKSSDSPLLRGIDHCSLVVADTVKALEFYAGILGMSVDETRPELGYPGAWLCFDGGQMHLLEVPNPDPVENRPSHGGRDRHIAFQVSSLDESVRRLEKAGIACSLSKSGRAALFCRDFDGNAIELIEKQ